LPLIVGLEVNEATLAVFDMFETRVIIPPVLKVTAAGTSKRVLTRTSPLPVRFVVVFTIS
jgi:hypothetical protein